MRNRAQLNKSFDLAIGKMNKFHLIYVRRTLKTALAMLILCKTKYILMNSLVLGGKL